MKDRERLQLHVAERVHEPPRVVFFFLFFLYLQVLGKKTKLNDGDG